MEGDNLASALSLIAGMNSTRTQFNESLLPKTPIKPLWLLGFIEGEGTFGIKNMVPYFQVAQWHSLPFGSPRLAQERRVSLTGNLFQIIPSRAGG